METPLVARDPYLAGSLFSRLDGDDLPGRP